MKAIWTVLGSVCLIAATGCNDQPYKTVSVSGKVTYDDGTPIPSKRVMVTFLPQVPNKNAKEFPRMGTAELKADGTFDNVTTWKYADGVIPGKQKVLVRPLGSGQKPETFVDPEYSSVDKTPLEIEITKSMVVDLKVHKPKSAAKK